MRIKEFTGKTTQEAIDNGLAELGVTIADVHVDVLQEGAKGLFGLFGSKPACVRLTRGICASSSATLPIVGCQC